MLSIIHTLKWVRQPKIDLCQSLACVADALSLLYSASAQYRVRIPRSRKDICRLIWLASFLRCFWLARFELSVDRPNMTNSSWQETEPVIVWNETLESAWTTEVFLTLFLRSLCSAWSIVHFDWAKFCLAALSLTFRGYEAGLFHADWVISSRGLFFCRPAQCVCNRLLFYSKCAGFTVCFTYSDISLSMCINQC